MTAFDTDRGLGSSRAPIVAIYGAIQKDHPFPESGFLHKFCEGFGIDKGDIYVTPVIKDFQPKRPRSVYVDALAREIRGIDPLFALVLGTTPMKVFRVGDPDRYFPYLAGYFFPVLEEGFYGLLLPLELKGRPSKEVDDRIKDVVDYYLDLKKRGVTRHQEVPKAFRGDMAFIQTLAAMEGFQHDSRMQRPNSYLPIWSQYLRSYMILCQDTEAKRKWLRLGFGVVLTMEEAKILKETEGGKEHVLRVIQELGLFQSDITFIKNREAS